MEQQLIVNLVNDTYKWFNKISDPNSTFLKEELEKFFTNDFIMVLNNEKIVDGQNSLYKHFTKFRESGYKMEVILPLEEIIISNDTKKCIAKYIINKNNKNATSQILYVMAIWYISSDYKLQKMNEIVYFKENNQDSQNEKIYGNYEKKGR